MIVEKVKNLPFIVDLRKYRFEKVFTEQAVANYFRGVYPNFTSALQSAPATKPLGYDNVEAANMYKERTKQIYSTDYPVLYWMNKFKGHINSIFDFGGHIGVHFYSYEKYLDYANLNRWLVCDVPSVLEEGKRFEEYKNDSILDFTADFEMCEGIDLLLANGSIQYVEWELHEKLSNIKEKPRLVILNMTPLHEEFSTITLQSIGTSFCPYYLRLEKDFVRGMESIGYRLLDVWNNEEKRCNIAFEKKRSLDKYKGMVFCLD
ncbi:MAG: methyltransferase, TIGR04325 family [Bacteriovoracaceae bacterium]|nr:methyltransferase, TIGR04325 family [Bacteriovoracaceae bacterium]